jgi:hypothetical protein
LFRADGAPGICPPEPSPLARSPQRFRPGEPTCRFSRRYRSHRSKNPSRRAAAPGLCPFRESLAGRRVISAPASRMLPWVFPLPGHFRENLERDSARSPLTRFAESLPKEQPGRRPRVSIGSRFTPFAPAGRPANAIEVTLLGFPHLSAPEHSEPGSLGLWVHLLPCRTSLPTSRQSLKDPTPCRSCPGSAQVPSLRDLGPVASFRVFGFTARDAGVTGGESSSCEVGVSSRVCRPPKYRPYWLGDPALPLAVASAMRFSLAGPR